MAGQTGLPAKLLVGQQKTLAAFLAVVGIATKLGAVAFYPVARPSLSPHMLCPAR